LQAFVLLYNSFLCIKVHYLTGKIPDSPNESSVVEDERVEEDDCSEKDDSDDDRGGRYGRGRFGGEGAKDREALRKIMDAIGFGFFCLCFFFMFRLSCWCFVRIVDGCFFYGWNLSIFLFSLSCKAFFFGFMFESKIKEISKKRKKKHV
jgi:hypothetical protein